MSPNVTLFLLAHYIGNGNTLWTDHTEYMGKFYKYILIDFMPANEIRWAVRYITLDEHGDEVITRIPPYQSYASKEEALEIMAQHWMENR